MMRAPNMAAITASLEESLQNCSLNRHRDGVAAFSGDGIGRSSSSDDLTPSTHNHRHDDAALELNSHISLPYHWEQCLDLTTGEIYYVNWRNGTKAKEDPRLKPDVGQEEEEDDEDDGAVYSSDESSYDSEGSSSESSPSTSTSRTATATAARDQQPRVEKDHVLVVAGCKICLMYFMVPKQVEDCPKCSGQLLHFDRSDSVSGSP